MNSAVTIFPLLPSLYFEDISDALEYVGLIALTDRKLGFQPYETSATYVGYGFGLCKNYTDFGLYKVKEKELLYEEILAVSYSQNPMIVVLYSMSIAYINSEPESSYIVDSGAGLGALENYPDHSEAY